MWAAARVVGMGSPSSNCNRASKFSSGGDGGGLAGVWQFLAVRTVAPGPIAAPGCVLACCTLWRAAHAVSAWPIGRQQDFVGAYGDGHFMSVGFSFFAY